MPRLLASARQTRSRVELDTLCPWDFASSFGKSWMIVIFSRIHHHDKCKTRKMWQNRQDEIYVILNKSWNRNGYALFPRRFMQQSAVHRHKERMSFTLQEKMQRKRQLRVFNSLS